MHFDILVAAASVERLNVTLNNILLMKKSPLLRKMISERLKELNSKVTVVREVSSSNTNQEEASGSVVLPVDDIEAMNDDDADMRRREQLNELMRWKKSSSLPSNSGKPSSLPSFLPSKSAKPSKALKRLKLLKQELLEGKKKKLKM